MMSVTLSVQRGRDRCSSEAPAWSERSRDGLHSRPAVDRRRDPVATCAAGGCHRRAGVMFAYVAWYDWRVVHDQALQEAARTVQILREHALKVFEAHEFAIDQIEERIRNIDWAAIRSSGDLQPIWPAGAPPGAGHVDPVGRTGRQNRIRLERLSGARRRLVGSRLFHRLQKAANATPRSASRCSAG